MNDASLDEKSTWSRGFITRLSMIDQNIYDTRRARERRAAAVAEAGGIEAAIAGGVLDRFIDTTLSEALLLGLIKQDVRRFVGVFGHGSTEIGEVLRLYEEAGLVKMYAVRNEIEASHAATALRRVTGEKAAVITSIGPGAMQAAAASLTPASGGTGVWYLLGDETSEDEGPNMQQIPKHRQQLYLEVCSALGEAYTLHTPGALATALRRGGTVVDHPHAGGPFFLLLPMNVQPAPMKRFNLDELPGGSPPRLGAAQGEDGRYELAAEALLNAERVVVRVGGGGADAGVELVELLGLVDGVAILSPVANGTVPGGNRRNMGVAGSKGSICGNYAMENADTLLAVGTRFVCQSDCSRTGFLNAKQVVNINTCYHDAVHYGRTIALVGDAAPTLRRLIEAIEIRLEAGGGIIAEAGTPPAAAPAAEAGDDSPWLTACSAKRREWEAFKEERYANPILFDAVWGKRVLTQPAAIKAAVDWARQKRVTTFFDAGDVQANGLQIVEDERPGLNVTDTGASYMGFAASALLASAMAEERFYGLALCGDGSFLMNPQILADGVAHGVSGCILLMDNRRMGAISSLQEAQYGAVYATGDGVAIDFVAMARSVVGVAAFDGGNSVESLIATLDKARAHKGLSLIHLPVYFGPDPLGGLGAWGRWNVGSWTADTQALRHETGL